MTKVLNIGMIGYGFMGRAHSNAWASVANFFDTGYRPVLKAVAGRDHDKLRQFADRWAYQSVEQDWRTLVERKDVDAIDVCAPNDLHAEISIAAARAGKMVLCEKPMSITEVEGRGMVEAVEQAGVPNMVWFNYRRVPAVALMKRFLDDGRLGRIFHYRAKFLQDWGIPREPPREGAGGRQSEETPAGAGVTGDLLVHCLDTALWINGPLGSLTALTETFVKQRTDSRSGEKTPSDFEDAVTVMARFENGSIGTFESSRVARGHKAAYIIEINGDKGSLAWDLHDLNRLHFYDNTRKSDERGWNDILVTERDHPYMGKWWIPGLIVGYEHSFIHQIADFLEGVRRDKPAGPTFRDGLEIARLCDAVLASGKSGDWAKV